MRRVLLVMWFGAIVFVGCREGDRATEGPRIGVSDSVPRAHRSEQGGMYRDLQAGYRLADSAPSIGRTRSMESHRARRAFDGAPPWIPHPVSEENERTGTLNCLNCHRDGGYVPSMDRYAPTTPHPEWTSCRQCHVPGDGGDAFKPSGWKKPPHPVLNARSQPAGPPMIPHSIQYRGNCLACHAGPSAPVEIRTSHPQRTNCRQCHVPSVAEDGFAKDLK